MKTMQPPDGIILTLSQRTIQQRRGGYKQIVQEWKDSNGEKMTWWYRSGTAPRDTSNIEWVYWVVAGRIRWRCRLLEIEKNVTKMFSVGNPMFGKNWFVMFDFEPIPKHLQVEHKGFQGFRYYYDGKTNNT